MPSRSRPVAALCPIVPEASLSSVSWRDDGQSRVSATRRLSKTRRRRHLGWSGPAHHLTSQFRLLVTWFPIPGLGYLGERLLCRRCLRCCAGDAESERAHRMRWDVDAGRQGKEEKNINTSNTKPDPVPLPIPVVPAMPPSVLFHPRSSIQPGCRPSLSLPSSCVRTKHRSRTKSVGSAGEIKSLEPSPIFGSPPCVPRPIPHTGSRF